MYIDNVIYYLSRNGSMVTAEKVRKTLQTVLNFTPVPLPFRSYGWIPRVWLFSMVIFYLSIVIRIISTKIMYYRYNVELRNVMFVGEDEPHSFTTVNYKL